MPHKSSTAFIILIAAKVRLLFYISLPFIISMVFTNEAVFSNDKVKIEVIHAKIPQNIYIKKEGFTNYIFYEAGENGATELFKLSYQSNIVEHPRYKMVGDKIFIWFNQDASEEINSDTNQVVLGKNDPILIEYHFDTGQYSTIKYEDQRYSLILDVFSYDQKLYILGEHAASKNYWGEWEFSKTFLYDISEKNFVDWLNESTIETTSIRPNAIIEDGIVTIPSSDKLLQLNMNKKTVQKTPFKLKMESTQIKDIIAVNQNDKFYFIYSDLIDN